MVLPEVTTATPSATREATVSAGGTAQPTRGRATAAQTAASAMGRIRVLWASYREAEAACALRLNEGSKRARTTAANGLMRTYREHYQGVSALTLVGGWLTYRPHDAGSRHDSGARWGRHPHPGPLRKRQERPRAPSH